jgi:hypothetical protein
MTDDDKRAERAVDIARHAISNARAGRETVTLRIWVKRDGTVRLSSGEPGHPYPLVSRSVAVDPTRKRAHADLDLVLDALGREFDR